MALPLLGLLGYTPGTRDPAALQVLTIAYCLLPCALTERGVAMLAGLLRSEKALKVSLALLYAFSRSGQAQERRFLTQDDLASSVTAVASSSAERSSSARALAPCGPQA